MKVFGACDAVQYFELVLWRAGRETQDDVGLGTVFHHSVREPSHCARIDALVQLYVYIYMCVCVCWRTITYVWASTMRLMLERAVSGVNQHTFLQQTVASIRRATRAPTTATTTTTTTTTNNKNNNNNNDDDDDDANSVHAIGDEHGTEATAEQPQSQTNSNQSNPTQIKTRTKPNNKRVPARMSRGPRGSALKSHTPWSPLVPRQSAIDQSPYLPQKPHTQVSCQ
jgi:hypothetical protein